MFRFRKNTEGFLDQVIREERVIFPDQRTEGKEFLVSFFGEIRPKPGRKNRDAEKNMGAVIDKLQAHPALLRCLQQAIYSQLINSKLQSAITESGIPLSRGFWQELSNRLKHKIIPPLQDETDFLYVLNSIFFKKTDYKWVEAISRSSWIRFFETTGFRIKGTDKRIKTDLMRALRTLSFQVAQLGLEREVLHYLPEAIRDTDNAFVGQHQAVQALEKALQADESDAVMLEASGFLKEQIKDCYRLVEYIQESHSENGASLQQTYLLMILNNRLERMQLIADVLDADTHFDAGRLTDIFRMLVRNEKRKNSILEFLSQGLGYIAYQIAEHKGHKGHKYITETRGEFFKMLRSAMWGGLIICFTAIAKNLIGKLKLAPFPLGFLYSVNYSAGFILIEQTNSTLATKQPAFTASAVAASLDVRKTEGEPDLEGLAATVARVSRSQLASFFGNLVIVFPVTFLLAWAWHQLTGQKISEGEAAFRLLKDQHLWRSPSLLYACFTGVFLFASGIIAGYWQNKIRYGRIRERLLRHPLLNVSLSSGRLAWLANFTERNTGAIAGSLALGFFLGFSGVVGKIFGIPFDIRHITIASGNVSIGMYGLGLDQLPPQFMLGVLAGVAGIGFFNFAISFTLAFIVAIKSRGIHLSQYPRLVRIIFRYFFRHPREFFLPPRPAASVLYRPLSGSGNVTDDDK